MAEHVMLDLETLGRDYFAPVLSLGAVRFDTETFEITKTFHYHLNLNQQNAQGRRTDPETALWWMAQSEEARIRVIEADRSDVVWVLEQFKEFYSGAEGLWGNGAAFDEPILRSLFHMFGIAPPWSYKHSRCFRTVKALDKDGALKPVSTGVVHDALDDAIWQLRYLHALRNAHGLSF